MPIVAGIRPREGGADVDDGPSLAPGAPRTEGGRVRRERVGAASDLALLHLQIDPHPGRTAAQRAAVGEETRRPKSPRTTMRSRTGHTGGDDPISDEIEPTSQDS